MSTSLNILFVEDDPMEAEIFHRAICSYAVGQTFTIKHVERLTDALKVLRNQTFDAILVDLNFPDISGLDVVKVVQNENAEIPIVVLTAVDSDRIAGEVVQHGAQEYLYKGYSDGRLIVRTIRSAIQRKKLEREMFSRMAFDALTGLPNQRLFTYDLGRKIDKSKRVGTECALLLIDIDTLKTVNNMYGYDVGDRVLETTAERLRNHIRSTDQLARFGDDEFVLTIEKLSDSSAETLIAATFSAVSRIFNAICLPHRMGELELDISYSGGISLFPTNGSTVDDLINQARWGLKRAKVMGENTFAFFNPDEQLGVA